MKLTIDISDKMFDTFKKHGIMAFDHLELGLYDQDQLAVAIANGTPVSTDGDLISRSYLKKEFDKHCVGQCNECHYCGEGGDCTLIDNAPTVEPDMKDNKFLREDKE